jgi:hypothetical protein
MHPTSEHSAPSLSYSRNQAYVHCAFVEVIPQPSEIRLCRRTTTIYLGSKYRRIEQETVDCSRVPAASLFRGFRSVVRLCAYCTWGLLLTRQILVAMMKRSIGEDRKGSVTQIHIQVSYLGFPQRARDPQVGYRN